MSVACRARNWGLVKECWRWLLIEAKVSLEDKDNYSFEHVLLQSPPNPPLGVLQSQSMAVYIDAIAMLGTVKDLEEAWSTIQSIPLSQRRMMMNNYTAYMEALFRLGQSDAAIDFFLGPPNTKGQDVVSRYKARLDPKSVGVFMKHFRCVTPDPEVAIRKMEAVWPLIDIRSLVQQQLVNATRSNRRAGGPEDNRGAK